MDQKVCLNMVTKDKQCVLLHSRREITEILKILLKMVAMETSHSLFEVAFYSIDANTSCSFSKQDLTVK